MIILSRPIALYKASIFQSISNGFRIPRNFSTASYLHGKRSASSNKWLNRQGRDHYTKEAKLLDLKSRAAFKLIELDEKFRLFKPNMTVVDLGFAPGSWSQVAVDKTAPRGRVIGLDILFCQPPRGASAIQGNFLSSNVQNELKALLADPHLGRPFPPRKILNQEEQEDKLSELNLEENEEDFEANLSYIDRERHAFVNGKPVDTTPGKDSSISNYSVDLVLSDM